MSVFSIFTNEREIKMVWRVTKNYKTSHLIGTTHFFPYSFRKSLIKYISNAKAVFLEGPLDDASMAKVIEEGSKGETIGSLKDILDEDTIYRLRKLLSQSFENKIDNDLFRYIHFSPSPIDPLDMFTNQRPWLMFLNIWALYRSKKGWTQTMDRDIFHLTKELNKNVYFIETIEEQISALNGVPIERIIRFLRQADKWNYYLDKFAKFYLKGDLVNLLSVAKDFPTYCESIIHKRDPIFFQRLRPYFEEGDSLICVGITHIQGLMNLLCANNFSVDFLR